MQSSASHSVQSSADADGGGKGVVIIAGTCSASKGLGRGMRVEIARIGGLPDSRGSA